MKTIGQATTDLEQKLTAILGSLIPQTARLPIRIEIRENGKKKRTDARCSSWRPEASGEILIHFGGALSGPLPEDFAEDQSSLLSESRSSLEAAAARRMDERGARRLELLASLNKAEQRPGLQFVALKWFRDQFLPAEGSEWTQAPDGRDEALRSAIDDGIVLTHRVPNPKDPRFPTTAIRLNRSHPDVRVALGGGMTASGFQPVKIQGKGLSETVLQERR